VSTLTEHDDDALLPRFGYRQQFVRSLRHFESFAVAFSFISITTGIFTPFAFTLTTGGPRGIWVWPIVTVGQTLVALVYGALAALGVGLVFYIGQWLLEPAAMRTEAGVHGAEALEVGAQPGAAPGPAAAPGSDGA
jgi:hypothetical protein